MVSLPISIWDMLQHLPCYPREGKGGVLLVEGSGGLPRKGKSGPDEEKEEFKKERKMF